MKRMKGLNNVCVSVLGMYILIIIVWDPGLGK